MEIYVCMGTSCYIKGSMDVVEILKKRLKPYIEESKIDIQLKGSFCLGPCIEGVVMRVGEKIFKNISPANINKRLDREILPYISKMDGDVLR